MALVGQRLFDDNRTPGQDTSATGNTASFVSDATVSSGSAQFDEPVNYLEIYDLSLTASEVAEAQLGQITDLSDPADDGTIDETTGDDTIFGGNSTASSDGGAVVNDTIDAGAGNDLVFAGNGDDTIYGGSGGDTFIVSAGGGDNTVTDFDTADSRQSVSRGATNYALGSDRIDLSGLTDSSGGSVTADEISVSGGSGSDQILTFPNGETLMVPDGTIDTTNQATQFADLVAMGFPP